MTLHIRPSIACCGLIALSLLAGIGRVRGAPAVPPNIVFILADDLGWRGLRCYGNDIVDTPHIDRLALQGARFTQAYAYPTCSPTRVSLMTGDYPSRHRMAVHINPHQRGWEKLSPPASPGALRPDTFSLADLLATRGYRSTLIGKWHLGYGNNPHADTRAKKAKDLSPRNDRAAFGFEPPPSVDAPGVGAAYDAALTAFARANPEKGIGPQTLQAVRFIERARERPFFCYLAFNSVHLPVGVRDELATKYRRRVVARSSLQDPLYLGMTEAMDEAVGHVLAALEALKLTERTVVIFASDNGGVIQEYHATGPIMTQNAPLRGQKATLWEGGIRVPLIVRWPGAVRAGSVCTEPTLSPDLFPTVAEIAGAVVPAKHSRDGTSLVPLLLGRAQRLPARALFWHLPAFLHAQTALSSAIREGDHKAIEYLEDGRLELYDLARDPGEEHDLAAEQPARTAALREKLHRWRESVGAEMPTVNPNYDPRRAHIWTVRTGKDGAPPPLEPLRGLPDRYGGAEP
jgi:arylsulfatase A